MPTCSQETLASADTLITLALDEDLQQRGDLTSLATVPADKTASVNIVVRDAGFLSGAVLIERVYSALCVRENVAANAVNVELKMRTGLKFRRQTLSPPSPGRFRCC